MRFEGRNRLNAFAILYYVLFFIKARHRLNDTNSNSVVLAADQDHVS